MFCTFISYNPGQFVRDRGLYRADLDMFLFPPPPPSYNVDEQRLIYTCDIHMCLLNTE